MAISPDMVSSPGPGFYEWERPRGVIRFTEFSLALAAPFQPTELKYENPFCRLAARTGAGARVCGQGCGICAGAALQHTCPFGLLMVQAPPAAGAAGPRWVGRRFPDVGALHEALDRLREAGFDAETILAHLPPNPIATAEEIRQAAGARKEPVPVVHEIAVRPAPPEAAAPAPDSRLGDLLEYLEQVHRLIAGTERPEVVCERFMRAVAAVTPFEEMAIYLRRPGEGEWSLAALMAQGKLQLAAETPDEAGLLQPAGLGAAALAQRQILVQRQGAVEPYTGRLEGPATVALPFPLAGDNPAGVWLALVDETARPNALGGEVVRTMRLLSELLAGRLKQLEELNTAQAPAAPQTLPALLARPEPRKIVVVDDGPDPALLLADALCAEVARGSRHNQPFTLLCLHARGRSSNEDFPLDQLTREFTATLRPYDTLLADPHAPSTWFVVLPYAQNVAARLVAARLMTIFEDVMDAHGGAEEQGARLAIGASIWGCDAAVADEMIVNATHAAALAGGEPGSSIQFFTEPEAVRQTGTLAEPWE